MINQNVRKFQESITQELTLTKDRVRDLIGDANWGEDGRFKEAILRRTISQFLPTNLKIGTGFIVGNEDNIHGQEPKISTQLDIIIYDGSSPVIFRDGDFVILTESSVRGVIEVKTKIKNSTLSEIVSKFDRLKQFSSFAPNHNYKSKFVGLFSFEFDGKINAKTIIEAVQHSNGLVNHISLGPNYFIRYWENPNNIHLLINYTGRFYAKYNLLNLSFSYFISNLLHIVSDEDPVERYWFSFPIEGTKELHRIGDIIKLD
jgi:hypothetical protein